MRFRIFATFPKKIAGFSELFQPLVCRWFTTVPLSERVDTIVTEGERCGSPVFLVHDCGKNPMIRQDSRLRDTGTLDLYLDQIRSNDLLSADEEVHLARAIAQGDSAARTRMIQANLRLVVRVARDYLGQGMTLDDLIGEGKPRFDPRGGGV